MHGARASYFGRGAASVSLPRWGGPLPGAIVNGSYISAAQRSMALHCTAARHGIIIVLDGAAVAVAVDDAVARSSNSVT